MAGETMALWLIAVICGVWIVKEEVVAVLAGETTARIPVWLIAVICGVWIVTVITGRLTPAEITTPATALIGAVVAAARTGVI